MKTKGRQSGGGASASQTPSASGTSLTTPTGGGDGSGNTEIVVELSKQMKNIKDRMDHAVHSLENVERAKQRLISNLDSHGRPSSPSSTSYGRSRLRSLLSTALNEAKADAATLIAAIGLCNQISKETVSPAKTSALTTSSTPSLSSMSLSAKKQPIKRGVLMSLLLRQGEILPVWVPPLNEPDSEPPPLCGSMPTETYFTAKHGDMVAARVRSDDGDDAEENWILAEVNCFNQVCIYFLSSFSITTLSLSQLQATNKYEVTDIDAEEGEQSVVFSPCFSLSNLTYFIAELTC